MGLLRDIQSAVVEQGAEIGSILLKVRLLAARLGSESLAEWVKHESEGYPRDAVLPNYRIVPVSYRATFYGPFGSAITNAPIPPYLIEKFGGEHWLKHKLRQSISSIEQLLSAGGGGGGSFEIDASNLILILQGKVYEGYACNSVTGTIARGSIVEIQQAVRSRVLELTIELERAIPGAAEITLGDTQPSLQVSAASVAQITNQIVYGDVTSISSSGDAANFNISFGQGDTTAFVRSLVSKGIPAADAEALGAIVATESPES